MVSKSNMKYMFFSWTVPWKHLYFNISIIIICSTHSDVYGGKVFLNTLAKLLDVQTLLLLDKVNFFFVKMHHIRYKNVQFHVQTPIWSKLYNNF